MFDRIKEHTGTILAGATLTWSVTEYFLDRDLIRGFDVNWSSVYLFMASCSGIWLLVVFAQFVNESRPSKRFGKLYHRIEQCRSVAEFNIGETPYGCDPRMDASARQAMDRHQLFSDLRALQLKPPDFEDRKLVMHFLTNMSLFSQRSNLSRAREYCRDLHDPNSAFELEG